MKGFKAFAWMCLATLAATVAAVPQTPGSVTISITPEVGCVMINHQQICPSRDKPGTITFHSRAALFDLRYNQDGLTDQGYAQYVANTRPSCSAYFVWPLPPPGQKVTYYFDVYWCLRTQSALDASGHYNLITNGREQCCFTLNGFKKDSESSYLDTGRTVTASDSHPETLLSESLLDQPLSEDNQDVSE